MKNLQGSPIWYELMTSAPDAAKDFYKKVLDWNAEAMPGSDYEVMSTPAGEGISGIMKPPEGAPFGPTWSVYFGVDDVDATTEKIKELGGSIHLQPQDINGVGRFAFVADPQGACFYVMRGDSDEASTAFESKPGHFSWNELVTTDQKAAFDFYHKLFGWTHGGAMPMGEMGDYTFIMHHGGMLGAVMDAPEKDAKPYWNFAIEVSDIDVAKDAIEAGGGTVRMGPHEIPDNSWLIQATDPQGATIMFAGPRLKATS